VLFRNGHSHIKDYMNRTGALAAVEESGHYYHRMSRGKLTISCENSILTVLLFLGAFKKQPELMEELERLEAEVFTTGEFNYQFENDATRDQAMMAVIQHCAGDGATVTTATPDGIDLEGTCLRKGVVLEPDATRLEDSWYSGYVRVATNEKGVVRSYFSAADPAIGKRVEADARRILGEEFGGRVVE
jgi:phosphomannomutase